MRRFRVICWLLCIALFVGMFAGLTGDRVVLAAQKNDSHPLVLSPNQVVPQDKLELSSQFPVLRSKSGDTFEFSVGLRWLGSGLKRFELAVTAPPKWSAVIMGGYPEKEIGSIQLEPGKEFPETIKVTFAPSVGNEPEPGEYVVTLQASSGGIKESIELKAVITGLYRLAFYTADGRISTEVTAGKENHLAVEIANTGTATLKKIDLVSSKPSGWSITFNPDTVENLQPGLAQEVDAVIEPPAKTIAGDYSVTMKAVSIEDTTDIELRVTVLTPTVWGWVGILIVLAIIAGLGVLFWRLGRR